MSWGRRQGRVFEKDEEGVEWCGSRNIGEEEVIGEVSGLARKYLYSNQLTIVTVEKIPEEKEPEVFMNHKIPGEKVTLEQK